MNRARVVSSSLIALAACSPAKDEPSGGSPVTPEVVRPAALAAASPVQAADAGVAVTVESSAMVRIGNQLPGRSADGKRAAFLDLGEYTGADEYEITFRIVDTQGGWRPLEAVSLGWSDRLAAEQIAKVESLLSRGGFRPFSPLIESTGSSGGPYLARANGWRIEEKGAALTIIGRGMPPARLPLQALPDRRPEDCDPHRAFVQGVWLLPEIGRAAVRVGFHGDDTCPDPASRIEFLALPTRSGGRASR